MGSALSARRTQPGGGPAGRGRGSLASAGDPAPALLPCAPAGRTFSAAVRRDRLWVGLEGPGAKVARLARASELYSAPRSDFAVSPGAVEPCLCALPGRGRARGPPPPARLSTWTDCPQCVLTASRRPGGDRPSYSGR